MRIRHQVITAAALLGVRQPGDLRPGPEQQAVRQRRVDVVLGVYAHRGAQLLGRRCLDGVPCRCIACLLTVLGVIKLAFDMMHPQALQITSV